MNSWPFESDPWRRESVQVGQRKLRPGDPVRLRPRRQADILDLALDGKRATIESIEENLEGVVYLAVLVDDDPGRDLGALRQPGHRFFFLLDEIEPLEAEQGEAHE